jgi:hypothetical protein
MVNKKRTPLINAILDADDSPEARTEALQKYLRPTCTLQVYKADHVPNIHDRHAAIKLLKRDDNVVYVLYCEPFTTAA